MAFKLMQGCFGTHTLSPNYISFITFTMFVLDTNSRLHFIILDREKNLFNLQALQADS